MISKGICFHWAKGGDDVGQLYFAKEEEFLEIMALVGMTKKPMHVRRLQTTLVEWFNNPTAFEIPLSSEGKSPDSCKLCKILFTFSFFCRTEPSVPGAQSVRWDPGVQSFAIVGKRKFAVSLQLSREHLVHLDDARRSLDAVQLDPAGAHPD